MRKLCICLSILVTVGCSGSNSSTGSNGGANPTGGNGPSGGSAAVGGTTVNGGSAAVGGTTTSGGGVETGGANPGGGNTSAGGSSQTGGASAGGGTTAGGGKTSTGGTSSATGGKTSAGGTSSATGGKTSAGGTGTTGGKTSAGGTSATGGATSASGGNGTGGNATGGNGTGGASSTAAQHWVGTWTASPYVDTNSNNTPPITLSNSVIRQVTHVSLGGSQIRVQFSNLWGNGSLVINGAHIALCKATPKVDSTIDATTDKALAFSGNASVTVAAGQEVWSDPIDFTVANQGNITITTSFGSVPSTLTQHSGSRTTSYFKSNGTTADLNAANMSSATTKVLWFFISAIDVMADASAGGVVAFGDSITDGRGTDNDMNNRWTDVLAARLQGNAATTNVSMMNEAIGATNVYGTGNTNGQKRYAHDVLGQSAAKYVIVLYGVNDIHGGVSVANITSAYKDLADRAHAHNPKILVYGGTILPFGGNTGGSDPYYSAQAETTRQQVNAAIKASSTGFDGVIDFDAALTDNGNPPKLQDIYSAWTAGNPSGSADGLHPGPEGYKKMGETPDLSLFTK